MSCSSVAPQHGRQLALVPSEAPPMATAGSASLPQTTPSEAEVPTQRGAVEAGLESKPTEFETVAPASLALSLEPSSEESVRLRHSGEIAGAVADEQLQVWNYGGTQAPSHVSNRPQYHP
jgi:hypothetical protein